MTLTVKTFKQASFRETMVMLPLKQYDALLEYMEDIEDRLAIKERAKEDNIPWEQVEKKFKKKFMSK